MVQVMAGAAQWPDTSERAEYLWGVLKALVTLEPRDIEPGDTDSAIYGAAIKGAVPGALRWLDTESLCLTDSGDTSILDLAVKLSNANGLPARYNRGALCLIREAEQRLCELEESRPTFHPTGLQLGICDMLAKKPQDRTALAGELTRDNRGALSKPLAELQAAGWVAAPLRRKCHLTEKGRQEHAQRSAT